MISKTKIVEQVAQQVPVNEATVKLVVDAFLDTIVDDVKKGDDVRFIGFGKFYTAHRAARVGRNPQTGESMQIKESNKLAFKSTLSLDD